MRCHKKGFTIRKKSTMIENHKSQAVQESVEEKSRMQEVPRESRPQECGAESGLAEWIAKTVSERPLIGHGGPVTGKGRRQTEDVCNKGGTAFRKCTSLAIEILQGIFCVNSKCTLFCVL